MTGIQVFEIKLRGIRPLLMHNGRLADPLDPATQRLKEATDKRKKTIEDHEEIARREWEGGLYLSDGKIVVPGDVIDGLIRDGAKAKRLGKATQAGVMVQDVAIPLEYDGPSDWAKLYDVTLPDGRRKFADRRAAPVKGNRVMRTRPRFNEWALTFRVERYDFAEISGKGIRTAIEHAGVAVGLMDYRPKFGLFVVESFKDVS